MNKMYNQVKAKSYAFQKVKGISRNQLEQHYELYKGYVNKINEIWGLLGQNKNFGKPNSTYSQMRCLKLGESYAVNGVKLHELYFENMIGGQHTPYGPILQMIQREYGSYEFFKSRMRDVGLSMRGWAVLALDLLDYRLHVYGLDSHDKGSVICAVPLLVLDIYEHAYMIEFGIDRKEYIEVFFKNINWDVVNKRMRELG